MLVTPSLPPPSLNLRTGFDIFKEFDLQQGIPSWPCSIDGKQSDAGARELGERSSSTGLGVGFGQCCDAFDGNSLEAAREKTSRIMRA